MSARFYTLGVIYWAAFLWAWGAYGLGATVLITVFLLALPVALGEYKFTELPKFEPEDLVPATAPATPDFDQWEKEL